MIFHLDVQKVKACKVAFLKVPVNGSRRQVIFGLALENGESEVL